MLQNKAEGCKHYPLLFTEAVGRRDDIVFTARTPGVNFLFARQRFLVTHLNINKEGKTDVAGVTLEMSFIGANPDASIEGVDEAPGKVNYFIGRDPSNWKTGLPSYNKLRYAGIWDGVDLEIGSSDEGLKLNWLLDTPERIEAVRVRWDGADALELDDEGNLLVRHALGTLTDAAPRAWQVIDGQEKPVECAYTLDGNEVLRWAKRSRGILW